MSHCRARAKIRASWSPERRAAQSTLRTGKPLAHQPRPKRSPLSVKGARRRAAKAAKRLRSIAEGHFLAVTRRWRRLKYMTKSTPLLTTADVARRLNVSVTTVTKWANEGKLAAIVFPSGHRRFTAGALRDFRRDWLTPEPARVPEPALTQGTHA